MWKKIFINVIAASHELSNYVLHVMITSKWLAGQCFDIEKKLSKTNFQDNYNYEKSHYCSTPQNCTNNRVQNVMIALKLNETHFLEGTTNFRNYTYLYSF